MPKWLFTVLVFAKIGIRRYFRDRLAIFFTVVFPLIFLFIFGGLAGNNNVSFSVALINQSNSQIAQQLTEQIKSNKTFKVSPDINNLDLAKQKMSRSEIDATILIPPTFGDTAQNGGIPSGKAVVYYDQNSAEAAQALTSVLQGVFNGANAKLVKLQTPLSVTAQSTNETGLSKFDYTFSGLIGFAIIGLGIFGPVNYFPEMKKQGILRRLHITPLKVWQYFVSSVLSNSVVGLFSIAIMFLVAISIFNFKMAGSYFQLIIFVILGILTIFGIGLAIGGWAKNERQAAPLANIIVFPMMFLSGTFFPRFAMPLWLQHITYFLPLTPIIDGIRMIATEGKTLLDLGPQLLLIGVWAVIIYAIAFRVFRWE